MLPLYSLRVPPRLNSPPAPTTILKNAEALNLGLTKAALAKGRRKQLPTHLLLLLFVLLTTSPLERGAGLSPCCCCCCWMSRRVDVVILSIVSNEKTLVVVALAVQYIGGKNC